MRLDINSKYCITSDQSQMIVNEKGKVQNQTSENFGNETLRPIAYCRTVQQCYNFLLHRQIRESKATSFKQLMEDVKRIEKELTDSIKI